MSTALNTTKKPAGRPPVTITWPDGGFTVQQLQAATKLSKVTLYQKVNEALENHEIEQIDKEKTAQGRPRIVFRKKTCGASVASTSAVASIVSAETTQESAPEPVIVGQ